MRHRAADIRSAALSCLAVLLLGCVQGPFTRPAVVVLYEDRGTKAAPAATSPRREAALSPRRKAAAPRRRETAAPPRRETAAPPRRETAAQQRRGSAAPPASRHTVRTGDTVYAVAKIYRVPIRTLIELNSLKAPYVLRGGQQLLLPAPRHYIVLPGDTIYGVARKFGVAISSLVRKNRIKPPYTINAGRELLLPVQLQTAAGPPARRAIKLAVARRAAPKAPARVLAAVPKPPPRAGRKFLLPVRGKIVLKFGSQGKGLRNDGINIAAALGTPVRAAENGIVVYSGNALLGFGNMVLILHADGFMTAYAHNRSLGVRRGDVVRRGQIIAKVGRSGNVSTPQLHFEVRKGKRAVNPARYLSSLAAISVDMFAQSSG